ncbi:Glycosyltransferase involved in cell wall bisynthesis [Pilibacter termitis]|uniref:Glycosyltransferase involved in cell wall bisynthesis n=1 Tax=Pilibacter termitis TaxID=263852 RepID=A0A1T4P487_9ENTE|nr:glycosyltransferase [Pilibacter termitis]SJZ86211.1 Glycosyltransferase involved in cell wall bisynthesis [Pilibacter termitis]
MKIVLVNVLGDTKSTGRIVKDLYFGYVKAGHDCTVCYGRLGISPEIQSYKIGNKFDMYEHAMETFLFDNHGLSSRGVTKRFVSFLRKYNPDVIHLHNIHGYYLNFPILFDYLNKEFKGKVIWTLHDMWTITGHSAYLPEEEVYLESNPNAKKRLKEYPVTFIDKYQRNLQLKKRYFSKREILFVTPSNWLTTIIKKSFLGKNEVKTIYNGIDLADFYPREQEKQRKKIVLAVASIWEERKGLSDINILAEKLSDEFQVIVVGSVPKGVSLSPRLVHIESTNDTNELAQLYSKAYVFINPTYDDNFPTVNIESLACGTPVITYNTGGSPEAINRKTGLVVEQGNVIGLLEAVQTIQTTEEVRKACCKRGKEFSADGMVEKYSEIL